MPITIFDQTAPSLDANLALDEALTKLAAEHSEKAQLVNLRYFGGLTHEEAAEALGMSTSTADRHWAYARAWLYRQMACEEGRLAHDRCRNDFRGGAGQRLGDGARRLSG